MVDGWARGFYAERVITRVLSALLTACALAGTCVADATEARAEQGAELAAEQGQVSTMHGDVESSDTTHFAGPAPGPLRTDFSVTFAACPTILADSSGAVWALCTTMIGRAPVALLLDPATGRALASLDIPKGSLLGGVYAYLDERDRLVLVTGNNELVKLAKRTRDGAPSIAIDERVNVSSLIAPGDSVVGLVPDSAGNIWLATAHGRVGVLAAGETNNDAPALRQFVLGDPAATGPERIDNSISAHGERVAVATSHALYVLTASGGVEWRQAYDRGSARKPGQLSWGTGATPTFFGPTGGEYVTITDNADAQTNLLVYSAADGALVCSAPLFSPGRSGTENSAIGVGTSVIVASTYGYPYPAVPEGAGPSSPRAAAFSGGMERFEVADGACSRSWSQPIASAAVPRLSTANNTIYTVERPPMFGLTGLAFDAITIDASTGAITSRNRIGHTPLTDTLQMVGTFTPGGVWWQGAISGVYRMQAGAPGGQSALGFSSHR